MRRRTGIYFFPDGSHEMLSCIVTGEMSDGRKVWTECDRNKEPINTDRQYFLQTRGNYTEFVRI